MSVTLADVDEALEHCRAIPVEERGTAWQAYVDGLLEQRKAIQAADRRIAEIRAERAGLAPTFTS